MLFLKKIIAKILTLPFFGFVISKLCRDVLPFNGLKISTKSHLVTNKTKAQIFWHIYEGAEIRFIKKYFPLGYDTIELGSSIGVVSCYIRSKMLKENKLICVEAFPKLCEISVENLQLNGGLDNSKVYNLAVNYLEGDIDIYFNPGGSNTTGSISTVWTGEGSIIIDKTSLSKVKDGNNIKEYVLVMDIEGAEIEIFLNEEKALVECKHLFVELHETLKSDTIFRIDDMIDILWKKHNFNLIERYDNVCYFNK
jgi:FkbM family methyltransferase